MIVACCTRCDIVPPGSSAIRQAQPRFLICDVWSESQCDKQSSLFQLFVAGFTCRHSSRSNSLGNPWGTWASPTPSAKDTKHPNDFVSPRVSGYTVCGGRYRIAGVHVFNNMRRHRRQQQETPRSANNRARENLDTAHNLTQANKLGKGGRVAGRRNSATRKQQNSAGTII